MTKRISIIVPVYKAEKYIEECSSSILAQMTELDELILVDDGSPDKSGEICDNIATNDDRVRVIHQENSGVTIARKSGVKIAQGEWVTFVDADDSLPKNSLSIMYSIGNRYDTEQVIGFADGCECGEVGTEEMSLIEFRNCCITGTKLHTAPWGRLFRRYLFDNDFVLDIPRIIVNGEDMLMNVRISFEMKLPPVIVYTKVYNYRITPNSVTQTFVPTQQYEDDFHELLNKSIPSEAKDVYMWAFVRKRLESLNKAYYRYPLSFEWLNSNMYKSLLVDISRSNFHMSFLEKLKFVGNVKYNRAFVWMIAFVHLKVSNLYIKIKNIYEKSFNNSTYI